MKILTGSAVFATRSSTTVTFTKEQPPGYRVVVTGNGGNQGKTPEMFWVKNKGATGFVIYSGDNNSKATVDWIAVWE